MSRSVHVIALGTRTPVGLTAETSAAAVRAGISRVGAHPFMIDMRGDPVRAAVDGELDPTISGVERLVALATPALGAAIEKVARSARLPRVEVLLALPEARPGFSDADANDVLGALRDRARAWDTQPDVSLHGRGHAGALLSLQAAARRVAQGDAELAIAGGVDSYFEADTIDWLDENRQLAGEGVRLGFTPGEAAGFVALASGAACRARGLTPLATLRGVHTAMETRLIKTDAVNRGDGLCEAVLGACAALRLPEEAPGEIYCDINGERYRSEEWGFVAMRAWQAMRDPAYNAPADCWGDVGAASGALLCLLPCQAWVRGYARNDRALVWASSEGGLRGAAVLQHPGRG